MKAGRIFQYGSPEVIQDTDVARPEPGNGELRVLVKAAGVGHWDALVREARGDPMVQRIILEIERKTELALGRDSSTNGLIRRSHSRSH
jgi:NADPH:quinone reductase-like Zn-dependent oxidoreductase